MPLANARITNFPNILQNLRILAEFDGRDDIRNTWGSRLNIDQNGNFSRATGIGGAWNRGNASSMTQAYNQETVLELIRQAIARLQNQTVDRDPELRRAIFNGIRGTRWLFSAYSANAAGQGQFVTSMQTLDQHSKVFEVDIGSAIVELNQFANFYHGQVQPVHQFSATQSDFMGDNTVLGDGICAGISLKWLSRWVISGKSSFLDSKKASSNPAELMQYQNNLTRILEVVPQRDKLKNEIHALQQSMQADLQASIAKYAPAQWQERIKIYRSKDGAIRREIEKMKLSDPVFLQKGTQLAAKESEDKLLRDQILELSKLKNQYELRLKKKGGESTVLYREQKEIKRGDVFEKTNVAVQTRSIQTATRTGFQKRENRIVEIENNINNNNQTPAQLAELNEIRAERDLIQRAFAYHNNIRGVQGNNDTQGFLNQIADKHAEVMTSSQQTRQFHNTMYFRDSTEFRPEIEQVFQPLIAESERLHQQRMKVGYYISYQSYHDDRIASYRFSNPAQRISVSGGHAMAFHQCNDGTFLAFDPNYGEYSCRTGGELIDQFSRLFSCYSMDSCICYLGFMRVVRRGIFTELEGLFDATPEFPEWLMSLFQD